MTVDDEFLLKLTAWRENRSGGAAGMQSVMNVVLNRVKRDGTSAYAECVKRLQFSSITAEGPEAILWPAENDAQWVIAGVMAQRAQAASGSLLGLDDITGGATVYYAPKGIKSTLTIQLPTGDTVPFPEGWDRTKLKFTRLIAGQVFFTEAAS